MTYADKIRELRPHLSPSFLRLADFLLDSYTDAAFMTATELANHLDVDAATVVRFAQRLGYPGYPELQREVRETVKRDLLSTGREEAQAESVEGVIDRSFRAACENLEITRRSLRPEVIREFVDAIEHADRIIIFADGASVPLARVLEGTLRAGDYPVRSIGGSVANLAQAASSAAAGDLAIAVEVVRFTPYVSRGLEIARRRGARTAALVGAPSLETTRHADIIVAAHAQPGAGAPSTVGMTAFIVGLHQALAWKNAQRYESLSRDWLNALAYLEGNAAPEPMSEPQPNAG